MSAESSREKYRYNIHDIIKIQSTHRLPELTYFRVPAFAGAADIVIRSAFHANASPSAPMSPSKRVIDFDDGLGRLGFDIRLDFRDAVEVLVSPILALSPHVLYTNVIEPLLRWLLVQRGYALAHAACLAFDGRALLVTAKTDTGKTSTIILTAKHHAACTFLSDDMTILSQDGTVLNYPKPMTISFHTLNAAQTAPLPLLNRMALQVQSRLHSKSGRKVGLKLGNSRFPAASLNALVQMLIPPPKYMIDRLVPGVQIVETARLSHALVIERGPDAEISLSHLEMVEELATNAEDAYGFPPYPVIGPDLYQWDGVDLHTRERAIIAAAISGCSNLRVRSANFGWWKHIPRFLGQTTTTADQPSEASLSNGMQPQLAHS